MKTENDRIDLPGLEDDINSENRYYVNRAQLDQLYSILMDSITSSVVEFSVSSDKFNDEDEIVDEQFDSTRWRYMDDSEMLREIEVHKEMPENQDERHASMLELLAEIVSQPYRPRRSSTGMKHLIKGSRQGNC